MNELLLMKDMSDMQRMMFQAEMTGVRKDATIAVLLAVFLGDLGAHRFYLGQTAFGGTVSTILLDVNPWHRQFD